VSSFLTAHQHKIGQRILKPKIANFRTMVDLYQIISGCKMDGWQSVWTVHSGRPRFEEDWKW